MCAVHFVDVGNPPSLTTHIHTLCRIWACLHLDLTRTNGFILTLMMNQKRRRTMKRRRKKMEKKGARTCRVLGRT